VRVTSILIYRTGYVRASHIFHFSEIFVLETRRRRVEINNYTRSTRPATRLAEHFLFYPSAPRLVRARTVNIRRETYRYRPSHAAVRLVDNDDTPRCSCFPCCRHTWACLAVGSRSAFNVVKLVYAHAIIFHGSSKTLTTVEYTTTHNANDPESDMILHLHNKCATWLANRYYPIHQITW